MRILLWIGLALVLVPRVASADFMLSATNNDYGVVERGTQSAFAWTVTNKTDGANTITAVLGNTTHFSFVGTDSVDLAALDGTGDIVVECDPQAVGAVSTTLTFNDDNMGTEVVATLDCEGTNGFTIDPASYDYGNVPVGTDVDHDFTITNVAGKERTIESSEPSSQFSIQAGSSLTLANTGAGTLTVRCTPTSTGAKSTNVIIGDGIGPDVTVALDCNGTAPSITITPSSHDFGDVDVGVVSPPTQTLQISNTGNGTLKLGAITIAGDADFSIVTNPENTNVGPGGTADIVVEFDPAIYGARSATVSIASDDPSSPETVVLDGNGIDAEIVVNSTHTALPTFKGDSRDNTFTITNNGNRSATVSLNLPNGSRFQVNGGQADMVAVSAGSSTDVTITFTPDTGGVTTVNSTMTVACSQDNSGPSDSTVEIAGIGYLLALSGSLDAGDVDAGNTESHTLIIDNDGDVTATLSSCAVDDATVFQTQGSVTSIDAGNSANVGITVNPPGAASGVFATNLRCTYSADSPYVYVLNNELFALGVNVINRSVNYIGGAMRTFADTDVIGAPSEAMVEVVNTGNGNIDVTAPTFENDPRGAFSVHPDDLASLWGSGAYRLSPNATLQFRVLFSPPHDAAQTRIDYDANLRTTGQVNLAVRLLGSGIDRDIEVTNLLDSGTVYRNNQSATQITISNPGDASLEILDIEFSGSSGAFSVDSELFPIVIAAGADTTVAIGFKPPGVETFAESMNLITDDVDANGVSVVELVGIGELPWVSTDDVSLGRVAVGLSSEVSSLVEPREFRIANNHETDTYLLRGIRLADGNGQPLATDQFAILGFDNPPTEIAPGEELVFLLEFRPIAAGRWDNSDLRMQVFIGEDPLPIDTAGISAEAVDIVMRGGGCNSGGSAAALSALMLLLLCGLVQRREPAAVRVRRSWNRRRG